MNLRWTFGYYIAGLALAASLAALLFTMVVSSSSNRGLPSDAGDFLRSVDLSPLDRAAVHSEGRVKSFDSFAQEMLGLISGPRRIAGLPPDLAYLDLMLRPARYTDTPLIFVKQKTMRERLAASIEAHAAGPAVIAAMKSFRESGLIALPFFQIESVNDLMNQWDQDLVRTAKHVGAIRTSLNLSNPNRLLAMLTMIPPPDARADSPWLSLADLWTGEPRIVAGVGALESVNPALFADLRARFDSVVTAWQREDAPATNAALAELCRLLPASAPSLYPGQRRLAMESWYFRAGHLTWGWMIYLLSLVLLLMATVYRWETARSIGMGVFTFAFLLHSTALVWRWYVSGRWPNSNMFEAVTTSVWFGVAVAMVIEALARRTPLRNLFALGASGAAMGGLMAAHYLPELNPSINNMMPVLHDLWLYIHTNVVIASYALIAMAAVTATLYLLRRILGGTPDYARAGGAAALLDAPASPAGDPAVAARTSLGEVFDGATMILMELSFVMLWTGIIMGAIWADHSWGRPWGWDPKEVFALNTFLVFLILVHVRLKARDKGLWTALLAVAGAGVMIFNWIVINFVISGLHSYA